MTMPSTLISFRSKISSLFFLSMLLLVSGAECRAQIQSPSLAELQRNYAMRYLEPEPHMALAKYYFDHGDQTQAFYILEEARRGRFEEKIFNAAFYRVFDAFDNSNEAEAHLLAEYARNPDSVKTIDALADIYISREDWIKAKRYLLIAMQKEPANDKFVTGMATVLGREGRDQEAEQVVKDYVQKFPETSFGYSQRAEEFRETKPLEERILLEQALKRFPSDGHLWFQLALNYQGKNYQKAEEAFIKAAELAPESELVQTWAGRFFFKVKPNNSRALKYYFNAYFLNPHAYETEYVESRIQKLIFQLAQERFQQLSKSGMPLTEIVNDKNPAVVAMALERMAERWLSAYVSPVVHLIAHDDMGVRWEATQMLKTKVDSSFDETLRALLKDEDLRKRGLAAYIAVYRWKNDSFPIMKSLLKEESQLVRFDAISALIMEGGPAGRQVALAHAPSEPNATLKRLISTPGP